MQTPASGSSKTNKLLLVSGAALLLVAISVVAWLGMELFNPQPEEQTTKKKAKTNELSPFPKVFATKFIYSRDLWTAQGPTTDDDVSELADREKVNAMELKFAETTSASYKRLQDEPLVRLKLEQIKLTKQDLEEISRIKTLRYLSIRDKGLISDKELLGLTGPKELDFLSLRFTALTNEAINHVIACFPNLTHLELCKDPGINDDVVPLLKNLTRLKRLHLSGSSITDKAMPQIAALQLENLAIDDLPITDKGIAALTRSSVKQLDITHCPITDKGLLSLAKIKTLKWIAMFGGCRTTPQGIEVFRELRPKCGLSL